MTQFSVGPFQPVAPGVFVAVAEPASVNIGLIVGESGAVVIDTGSSPAQGAEIRAAAEVAAGVPLTAVVVTHAHYDHFFGLAGFAGITSFGHETLPEARSGEVVAAAAAELGLAVSALAAPDQLFSLARVIDLGGRRVEVLHFGPGHTDSDVVAYVPDADLIFAGDLLESAGPPSFGTDSHIKDWPAALDGVLGLVGEHTVLVPGHGPAMDRIAAFEQRAAIAGFYAEVSDLVARGVVAEAAYEAAQWAFDEETVRAALPLLYAQLAEAGLTPKRQLPLLGS
ncbi:MAG TPA: MBL fold metallo-hydrolase [Propionicimonas sp.]|nr:MBL fold metallo-hydrolase [Propionicimonas sp.]